MRAGTGVPATGVSEADAVELLPKRSMRAGTGVPATGPHLGWEPVRGLARSMRAGTGVPATASFTNTVGQFRQFAQ